MGGIGLDGQRCSRQPVRRDSRRKLTNLHAVPHR
jgi:hypothetical protein